MSAASSTTTNPPAKPTSPGKVPPSRDTIKIRRDDHQRLLAEGRELREVKRELANLKTFAVDLRNTNRALRQELDAANFRATAAESELAAMRKALVETARHMPGNL